MSKITEALQKAIKEKEDLNGVHAEISVPSHTIEISGGTKELLGENIVFFNHQYDPIIQESFRILRTNVCVDGRCRSILITSPSPKDGKSFISLNLATAMALAGDKVLLVDTHIGSSQIAEMLGVENTPGLMEIITIGSRWEEVVRQTPISNLHFIPSGYAFKNHTELFTAKRMGEILKEWERGFDAVILDSCPVSGDTDALLLAQKVQGVILVIRMKKTSKEATIQAKYALKRVGAKILGFVLTDVKSYIPKFISRIVG